MEQGGFRNGQSCTKQMFTLDIIIEQCLEHQKKLVINFIDFKKAFSCINQPSLWKILSIYGVPQQFITIFQALYNNSCCCIKTATGITSFFTIVSGVSQGCIFSPLLFIMVTGYVMWEAMNSTDYCIQQGDH